MSPSSSSGSGTSPLPRREFLRKALLLGATAGTPARVRGAARAEFGFAIAHELPKSCAELNGVNALMRRCQSLLPGQVEFYLMPRIPGGEPVFLKRIAMNQFQGAFLTSHGLGLVDPALRALQSLPLLAHQPAEVEETRARMRATSEKRLGEKGYSVVFWGGGGWIRWFSVRPIQRPADLKALKLGVDPEDPVALEVTKSLGVPVSLPANRLGPALELGQIDAALVSTSDAFNSGVAKSAKYMLSLPWASVVQALVVSRKSWDRLPADVRLRLKKVGDIEGSEVRANRWAEDRSAIKRLTDQMGVQVVTPSLEAVTEWDRVAADIRARLRGTVVEPAFHDELLNPPKAAAPAPAPAPEPAPAPVEPAPDSPVSPKAE